MAQAMVYFMAMMVHLLPSLSQKKYLDSLYYIVSGYSAGLIGLLRYTIHSLMNNGLKKRHW